MVIEEGLTFESSEDLSNIIFTFEQAKKAMDANDITALKNLSNNTIHSAALHQDPINIITTVLVYSMAKILERDHYRKMEGWDKFYRELITNWDLIISALKKKNKKKAIELMGEIRHSTNEMAGNLGDYIKEVFNKAEINKAFRLYEHGLTTQQTSELLGVDLWDLSSYIGQSHMGESNVVVTKPEFERIKYVEEFFS
jgi:hypothetical protein